jgi:biofilm PGA synthesis N-glycosyltransferase PgaC
MKSSALAQLIASADRRGASPNEVPRLGARQAARGLEQCDRLAPVSLRAHVGVRGDVAHTTKRGASSDEAPTSPRSGEPYMPVRFKFAQSLLVATAWTCLSYWFARPWIADLSVLAGKPLAYLAILSTAIIPGFMNSFLATGLLLDRRPKRKPISFYPNISILVAAYNEEDSIATTIESIARQDYPGGLEVIVINDGSTDGTITQLSSLSYPWLRIIDLEKNAGKAKALNAGLAVANYDLTITLDGDSFLYRNALVNIVGRILSDPANTAAVAGAVLVRNSRLNLVTKMQEWDYFHGIAAVKRLQSLFQGTLVAQGAFSIYRTDILRALGGWADCVGEDIVLTWAIIEQGYRVGFAEDACTFTNVPTTLGQLIRQRQRWSRGLIEAFRFHWPLLFKRRMSTVFIWWNLLFPAMDVAYTLLFVPGLILALFGYYWIAGPMTLAVLPLAMLMNWLMFATQSAIFRGQGLKVRHNPSGFIIYSILYGLILQPACVVGYWKEAVGAKNIGLQNDARLAAVRARHRRRCKSAGDADCCRHLGRTKGFGSGRAPGSPEALLLCPHLPGSE